MKLLYPDPRRRRPRFEYPGSAGAGPRQLSSAGHLHVAIPRLCWVSLLGLFRAAQGPSGSCRRHSLRSGVSLLPLMVQPPIFLLPPSPTPCILLQACSFPGPGSCWTQGLFHSASSMKPPQTAPPGSPGQGAPGWGGVLPGPGGQGSLPEACPHLHSPGSPAGPKVGVRYVCLGPPDPGWQHEDSIQAFLGP